MDVVATKRAELTKLISDNPGLTRRTLRSHSKALARWLWTNDREWFDQHLPMALRTSYSQPAMKVDWAGRDREYSLLVTSAAVKLRSQPGLPKRVTLARIERELSLKLSWALRYGKLPLTKAAAKRECETSEQRALRRIAWAVDEYGDSDKVVSAARLAVLAQVGHLAGSFPAVRDALAKGAANTGRLALQSSVAS